MKLRKVFDLFALSLAIVLYPIATLAGSTSGTIKGHLTFQADGPCGAGYSAYCPSGSCLCYVFAGTISGSPIGNGQAQVQATIDYGAALSSGRTCFPVFAELDLDTKRDVETVNAVGSACNTSGPVDKLAGGFGIADSERGAQGSGSVSGTFNLSTGKLVVDYSGATF